MKLVISVLAAVVAVSSASASERAYKHHHFRSDYSNSMNAAQGPALAPSYATAYHPHDDASFPGGSNLSGTGTSQFGGGGDPGSAGGGGP